MFEEDIVRYLKGIYGVGIAFVLLQVIFNWDKILEFFDWVYSL